MGVKHPSLWFLINCLRKVKAGRVVLYSQFEAGNTAPKNYRNLLMRIDELQELFHNYETITIMLNILIVII